MPLRQGLHNNTSSCPWGLHSKIFNAGWEGTVADATIIFALAAEAEVMSVADHTTHMLSGAGIAQRHLEVGGKAKATK